MKKKLGDLTLKEIKQICSKTCCQDCLLEDLCDLCQIPFLIREESLKQEIEVEE